MARASDPFEAIGARRIVFVLLLSGLLLLAYAVLQPFIVPAAWAAIMAYTTWPLNLRLRRALGGRPAIAATLMTLLLTVAIVLPLIWLMFLLRSELTGAYGALTEFLSQGPRQLPAALASVPWIGEWLQQWLDELTRSPDALRHQIGEWVEQRTGELLELLGGVGRNVIKLGVAALTVLFIYRDGDVMLQQARRVLQRFVGPRTDDYVAAIGSTTKAVVYGLLLAAVGQGALSAVGYWGAGVRAPLTLGVLTAAIALVPWGAPLVWGTIGGWLVISGRTVEGVGLLLWGMLVVSWIDNLLRPLVISGASRVPFLLVMFGVLGGVAAFGLIGLFVGPVILAVVMAVWREWLEQRQPASDAGDDASGVAESGTGDHE